MILLLCLAANISFAQNDRESRETFTLKLAVD